MTTNKNTDASFALSPYLNKKAATAIIALSLSMLACAAFIYSLWLPSRQQQLFDTLTDAYMQQQLSSIDAYLSNTQSLLDLISQSPDIITAFQTEEPELQQRALQQLQEYYLQSITDLVDIKLVPLGELGIGAINSSQYQLNNIELDMISTASRRSKQAVPPEAYRHKQQWLLSFAQASRANGKVIGVLLFSFNTNTLNSLLKIHSKLLNIELFNHPQHKQSLFKQGKQGQYTQSGNSKITSWQLQISPNAAMIQHYQIDLLPLWGCLLLVSCILILIVFFMFREVSQRLSEQIFKAAQSLPKIIRDKNAPQPNLQWLELQSLCQKVQTETNTLHQEAAKTAAAQQIQRQSPLDKPSAQLAQATTPEEELELDDSFLTEELEVPSVNPAIFRAYDIRGHAEHDLYPEAIQHIAKAIASQALDAGQSSLIIACDGRLSSPKIKQDLIDGILSTGCHAIDIGLQPTPILYFACHHLDSQSGIMITGSHNPKDDNGLKIVINQQALNGDDIKQLYKRIEIQDFHTGQGKLQQASIEQAYVDQIINDIAIAQPLKIVVDCGNGASSNIAPRIFEELGCDVIPLYCEVDGDFPNHHPDPSKPENLRKLIDTVNAESADLGIAFDGDGDRLGVVSASGQIIETDRLLMLLAQDVVSRNPGTDVVFDIKCTRLLNTLISSYGGRPIMWKSGHSLIKDKMLETGALLGGEYSGHIFFKERWFGFDDGLYSACRLIEILSTTDTDLDSQLEQFPQSCTTNELYIDVKEQQKFDLLTQLQASTAFSEAKISKLDGLRADFNDGWGLVRASNTTAKLTLRFEADTEDALAHIQALFKQELSRLDSSLVIPF